MWGMVVVMEEEFGLIVYVEVFILLMLVCVGVEEGNMFERVGMNVSSWFDKCGFMVLWKDRN